VIDLKKKFQIVKILSAFEGPVLL